MVRKIKWAAFSILAITCLFIILRFPLNKYVWMLEDPTLAGMDVQLPIDHDASMYPFLAGAPALVLCVFYFFSKARREKMVVLSVIGTLLVAWVIKFRSLLFTA